MRSLGVILLVDDNAPTREAIAGALRRSGEVVLEATSEREALSILPANLIHLVVTATKFMDLIHWRRPKLPIIVISDFVGWIRNLQRLPESGKLTKHVPPP